LDKGESCAVGGFLLCNEQWFEAATSRAFVNAKWSAAAAWGVASVLLSPCHLAAIPLVVAFAAGPAASHARLVSATPAPDSTVAATRTLTLTFSERSVPAFSGFDVVNAAGEKIAIRTSAAEDGRTLTGALARPLAAGAYRVDWRIASSDGHRMTGSYTFTVR
jgi:methionine-rich copper-binding protein CopC